MWKFFRKCDGSVMILTTLSIAALLGFAALAIDVGAMYTAKNQLQAAVDSAALAGASGLIVDVPTATTRAIQYASMNNCINQPVNPVTVTFPIANQRIRVAANRNINLYFARVFGMNTALITASAEAEIGPITGTPGMKPWAIPDSIPSMYTLGDPVVLKSGSPGAPGTNSGFFYPIDFPAVWSPTTQIEGNPTSGGNEYRDNIVTGAEDAIYIGDVMMVEPGNMIGPTAQGFRDLIAQDPGAVWSTTELGGVVTSPNFPEYNTSPRVIKIPFYDIDLPPDSGRNTVEVIAIGAFFVESMQGNDVVGRFMELTTTGQIGQGGTGVPSTLMGVHLVQ